ncbi:MAG: 4Fe-4S binding protein, partial [Planctomycetes bacterium]|nr:4Fe-4S binding protein [Planctomycetota bacterium]
MSEVSLPVVNTTTIRASKSGRRRAVVLVIVHALVAIHIALWFATGETMTPLEPSESMEFSKHGIVNAGLIFFALTILSTLFFGRWFCGWACHLVALQDLCRWMLGRLKLRPRPVNLGILGTVPLVAFVYMFIAPLVYRLHFGDSLAVRGVQLTTDAFWVTFPSWIPAVLTFGTCGFIIVYLLGAKGFCTYGCPYGAIFGVVDQLAVGSIRVTDACRGCGHCTAVCSSNVRVHQEVRDFGMVVDPGCMKCLDCVSVCPNDALYFGIGRPSMFATRRAGRRASRVWQALPEWFLTAGFMFGASSLPMW